MKDAIIAGVKGWYAALLALPLWITPPAGAAEDLQSAARELGRKTAFAAGRETVALTWRNLSSLTPAVAAQARGSFETALRDSGGRIGDGAPAEAQITLSENQASYLLVEEFRKGDDRQVWIASWKRARGASSPTAAVEKRLLWEQEEAILDVAVLPDGLLVLTPTALIRTAPRQSAPITSSRPWPRDVRGRLRVLNGAVEAHLPGVSCSGTVEPLTLSCRPSDEPWMLESGRSLLLAQFAPNRNYFDGRVVTQTGARKLVGAAFYSAAAVDGIWILAMLDGRAAFFDGLMEPAGTAGTWGSDVVASDARCGGSPVVLASRAGDGPDALQAYAIVNRTAVAIGAAAEFAGPVTALWWPGIAVVRNGPVYQAYSVAVNCGQ